jgi:tetraprenyl-beta-curcumene synthase
MSTATHHANGRVPHQPPAPLEMPARAPSITERLALPYTFAWIVLCHLLLVRPVLLSEYLRWQRAALQIPEEELRGLALASLEKRGNIEGAALLATLAPSAHRRQTVTAQVAFQALYNYLDALSEQHFEDPHAIAEAHEALLRALAPLASQPIAADRLRGDAAYVDGLVAACREAFEALPSHRAVTAPAVEAATRIVDFQSLNLAERDGGHEALSRWAEETTPAGSALDWWETAAAAGSSLPVHALIAAAADPRLSARQAQAVAAAYFPWIGALHSLLDSLVDREEDSALGRPSLLAPYRTPRALLAGLSALACRAREASARLPAPHAHRVIVTAMCSYYLSAPEARSDEARAVAASLESVLGAPLRVANAMFDAKRLLHRLAGRPFV